MGHKNKESLVYQVQSALEDKLAIGQSKHEAKILGTANEHIYSWSTFKTYMKHCNYFTAYCKAEHGCKTLEQCRSYVNEWLISRQGLSAYTQKLEASALAKMYGCKTTDFVKTATRNRSDIVRSRGEKAMDKHFSEEKNADLVAFARATGLRREELTNLTGDKLRQDETGKYYIEVVGKGGRYRQAPVIGDVRTVVRLCETAGKGKVFEKVHDGADIHNYRAEYATAIYKASARPIDQIPYDGLTKAGKRYQKDVYVCRGDQKGQKFDRQAMLEASRALGHNRVSVVGEHYLRGV